MTKMFESLIKFESSFVNMLLSRFDNDWIMFNLCLINQGQISTHKSTSGHMRVVQSDGGIILGGAEETKWKSKVQTKKVDCG